jgi:predicted transposase/invertase (TIGR01784 family)
LELPKLPEMADNYLWHWLRFLRAESKEDLDMVAQASPKLEKVVGKLLELSEDESARMLYEAEAKQERDNRARLRGAITEERMVIARKLLQRNMPINAIAEDTGLSREEIEKLR